MQPTRESIRLAGPSDAEAIAALHVAGWREAYDGMAPRALLDGLSVERRAAMWRQWLADPTKRVLVADRGFIAVGPDREVARAGELYSLYLRKAAWGSGLGLALWREAEAWMVAEGYGEVLLWVIKENARARRFYEKVGFRDIEEREESFGEWRFAELRYRKTLSPRS